MQAIRTNEKRPKTKTAGNGLFAAGPGENELCRFQGQPVVCGPRGLPGGTNILYRQRDDKFVNVSRKSGFDSPSGYYGFSVLTGDLDGDGWGDVYIACDSAPSILFRNNHDGAFSDIGLLSGAALNEHGKEQGGMGADSADYKGDGLPDIITVSRTVSRRKCWAWRPNTMSPRMAPRPATSVYIKKLVRGQEHMNEILQGFFECLSGGRIRSGIKPLLRFQVIEGECRLLR